LATGVSCRDNGSSTKDDDEEDTTVDEPENIAGTYLTCAYTGNQSEEQSEIGCKLANPKNGAKVELAKFVKNPDWDYKNSTTSDVAIAANDAGSKDWHVLYSFKEEGTKLAAENKTLISAIRNTYLEMTGTSLDETAKGSSVSVGSPFFDTMVTQFMHGDFDGDGYDDLLDRRADNKVDLYLYNPDLATKNFPFTLVPQDDLVTQNTQYTHFIAADLVADAKKKKYVAARSIENGIFTFYEYKAESIRATGEAWSNVGDLGSAGDQSFFRDFTHKVVGMFNGKNETMLMRKTDGRLEHKNIIAAGEGVFLSGTWNYENFIAGDFNGDHKDDLIAIDRDGNAFFFKNVTGARETMKVQFAASKQIETNLASFTHFVAADFTGDGLDDLIARKDDGTLTLLKPVGDVNSIAWYSAAAFSSDWHALDYFGMDLNLDDKAEFIGRNKVEEIRSIEIADDLATTPL
jgi:hypothetical protein